MSILKVGGLSIGQAHDSDVKTGVTVILPDVPATASVDVRGGGPGTREVSALNDGGIIEKVNAIVISGGSVYGLAAADSVTTWLGARGVGFNSRDSSDVPCSPIVPSAILFDNANGGNKAWGMSPPFAALGLRACEAANKSHIEEGPAGAGYGATAVTYAGGLGTASETVNGITVGAIIAANPVGSPYMPGTKVPHAWAYELEGEFAINGQSQRPSADYTHSPALDTKLNFLTSAGQSTVIGCLAIDAGLSQKQLKRLAIMAQDGIAMAVQPAHTPLDGDTLFALSTGDKPCPGPANLALLGAAAARCVARALTRGVLASC